MTASMVVRFLGHILFSALLAAIVYFTAIMAAERVTRDYPTYRGLLRSIVRLFPDDSIAFVVTYVLLFVFFLTLFQWRWLRYISELNVRVRHIAEGNFQERLPVRMNNQLSDLAFYMNDLVDRLQKSMDDERQAEQTKNELVTSVSHDLRTPLTSILGYLGLIEQDRYRDEVELRHYVQIAYAKSQRLNELINDLFEYTRMRHDAVPLNRVRINMADMMSELLVQYRVPLEEAGMTGHLALPQPGRSVTVSGDPGKLVRVFENLIANAIQYGREGKRLDIRVAEREGAAVVEVANYGEAISSADLPRLFDRFYRVDKSRAEHTGGSGLGLAIAKSIVERHGGTIGVSSDTDMTVFEVRLPLYGTE